MRKLLILSLALLLAMPAGRVYATDASLYEEDTFTDADAITEFSSAGNEEGSDGTIDFDYSGELDAETMLPSELNGTVSADTDTRVHITDEMAFNLRTGEYVYSIANGKNSVVATVADGMVTDQAVSISTDDGVSLTLYRDGEELSGVDFSSITATGDYSLKSRSGDMEEGVMAFSIIGSSVSRYSTFTAPNGFLLESVTLDDKPQIIAGSTADISQEGTYDIHYTCPAISKTYTLSFYVDRTAPEITLNGVDKDGKARGPVTIDGISEGDSIYIYREGEQVEYNGVLKAPGSYRVVVSDSAGNEAEHVFRIMIYLDSNSIIFFLVVVAVIASLIAYLVIRRKRFKIR